MTAITRIVERHLAQLAAWRHQGCVCTHSRSEHAGLDGLGACRFLTGCRCLAFATAVLGRIEALDDEQLQPASGSEPGWEAYEGLSPLEARHADGDR